MITPSAIRLSKPTVYKELLDAQLYREGFRGYDLSGYWLSVSRGIFMWNTIRFATEEDAVLFVLKGMEESIHR